MMVHLSCSYAGQGSILSDGLTVSEIHAPPNTFPTLELGEVASDILRNFPKQTITPTSGWDKPGVWKWDSNQLCTNKCLIMNERFCYSHLNDLCVSLSWPAFQISFEFGRWELLESLLPSVVVGHHVKLTSLFWVHPSFKSPCCAFPWRVWAGEITYNCLWF